MLLLLVFQFLFSHFKLFYYFYSDSRPSSIIKFKNINPVRQQLIIVNTVFVEGIDEQQQIEEIIKTTEQNKIITIIFDFFLSCIISFFVLKVINLILHLLVLFSFYHSF